MATADVESYYTEQNITKITYTLHGKGFKGSVAHDGYDFKATFQWR